MNFAAFIKGTKATKLVTLPYEDQEIPILVRPMNGHEEATTLAGGRAYAISKGVQDPKPMDRLFEIGVMAHVLAMACIDPEDPEKKRPFFVDADQVLQHLDTDRIALLYEHQRLFQDECSPRKLSLNTDEFLAKVIEIAESTPGVGDDPFANMQPVLRWIFTHTLASQWLTSLRAKSDGTAPSEGRLTSDPNETHEGRVA